MISKTPYKDIKDTRNIHQSTLERFHIAIALMSVIPLLICCYLITVRFYSIQILVGLNGFYFFIAVLSALLGLLVGQRIIRETVERLVEANLKSARLTAELASINERLRLELISHELAEETSNLKSVELARSKAELDQLELFSYVASHDLREPLYKIICFGDLLKMHSGGRLDEKGRYDLELMQKTAQRMSQMIEDIKEFSKINKQTDPLEAVDLRSVIQGVLLDLSFRIKETEGHIEIGELHTVLGDGRQLHQLFQNLVANAIKFHRREVPPRVMIKSQATPEGSVEVMVEDNGIGFDEKYLDRIFKPFQKLHGLDVYGGSGMGLAICQKIVLRHGGKITAKSVPEQGTTFIVTLAGL